MNIYDVERVSQPSLSSAFIDERTYLFAPRTSGSSRGFLVAGFGEFTRSAVSALLMRRPHREA
jgi:hypothetical protein